MSRSSVSLYTTVVAGFSMIHLLRRVPWGSMRKNERSANYVRSLKTP
jgi:hypothetical protein